MPAALFNEFLPTRLERLFYWISERESIRRLKEAGAPKPWTDNPVLRSVRFCNVRRMDDKVSVWLLENWYGEDVDKATLLASVALARLINWPDALKGLCSDGATGRFTEWDMAKAKEHFQSIQDKKQKVFTGAYIINAAGGGSKIDIVLRQVNTFYKHPELVDSTSMNKTHTQFQRVHGIGSFIAGQMVADLRHVWQGTWVDRDWWAPIGPGSHRGMSWLLGWDGVEKLPRMRQEEFQRHLAGLAATLWATPWIKTIINDRRLEAHDFQNCLCEYDKFMRLSMGTGRAKNQYPGAA